MVRITTVILRTQKRQLEFNGQAYNEDGGLAKSNSHGDYREQQI